MTRYIDLNSYSMALQFKDGIDYVIVCEGESDKKVLDRVFNESKLSGKCHKASVTIDSIQSMIKNKGGLGNRQCVINSVVSLTQPTSTIFGFIDREYDNTNLRIVKDNFRTYNHLPHIYTTRGHSIENYFLSKAIMRRCLVDVFSSQVDFKIIEDCAKHTDQILRWLLALSIYFKIRSIISRTREDFFEIDSWEYDAASDSISPNYNSIRRKLALRGASATIINRIESYSRARFAQMSTVSMSYIQQLVHGHIGYEGLMTAYGSIALSKGISAGIADNIARGSNDAKERFLIINWMRASGGYSKLHPLISNVIRATS